MKSKLLAIAILLSASASQAGYLPTDIMMRLDGSLVRLKVSGSKDTQSTGRFNGIMLSSGGRIFAIDAKSDKAVLSYLGHLLCNDLSHTTGKKFSYTGALEYGYGPQGNGSLLLSTRYGQMSATLTPIKSMIVGVGCTLK